MRSRRSASSSIPLPSTSGASGSGFFIGGSDDRRASRGRHPGTDARAKIAREYVALGAQDLAGFRSDRRAGAARRLNPGYPAGLNKRRLWGDLADTLVARSIEN